MTQHKLQSFFWPQSIAVLGASPDLHRIRGRLLHQLRENGYPGRILPINPSYQEITGLRCYASIGAVGRAGGSRTGGNPRCRRCRGVGGMRARRSKEHADHQFRVRGRGWGGRRYAGGTGRGDAAHRHSRLWPKLRGLFQCTRQNRHHLQSHCRGEGGRRPDSGIAAPCWRYSAVRRHRLRAVQSRQGGGDRLLLCDFHGQ